MVRIQLSAPHCHYKDTREPPRTAASHRVAQRVPSACQIPAFHVQSELGFPLPHLRAADVFLQTIRLITRLRDAERHQLLVVALLLECVCKHVVPLRLHFRLLLLLNKQTWTQNRRTISSSFWRVIIREQSGMAGFWRELLNEIEVELEESNKR